MADKSVKIRLRTSYPIAPIIPYEGPYYTLNILSRVRPSTVDFKAPNVVWILGLEFRK